MTVLVLYVPVLHESYIKFFKACQQKAETLYIIDQDVIDRFPKMQREIRAIAPSEMLKLIIGGGYFPHVKLADDKVLRELGKSHTIKVVMTEEAISDYLKEHYFQNNKVTQKQLFLRFDEKTVKHARKETKYTGQVISKDFNPLAVKRLHELNVRNSDWFLQVSAAIIKNAEIVAEDINRRMPTPHSMWTFGDPRNYMDYGSDTHQRASIHAEQAVIAHAARDGISVDGASMYVTAFPCPDCTHVIVESGIKKVYFLEGYSQLSSTDVFEHYSVEVIKIIPMKRTDQKKPEPGQTAQ
jgi:dCMP deaminase